ncbi:MAG: type II toxin-antitoxin system prevent-host-death family antitoxin [Pseudolysinimonas sp.]
MESVGIRELKQNASEVVARAERGETITITVQGRPVAQLAPLAPVRQRWVSAEVLDHALEGFEPDPTWAAEAYVLRDDDPLVDPWERAGL